MTVLAVLHPCFFFSSSDSRKSLVIMKTWLCNSAAYSLVPVYFSSSDSMEVLADLLKMHPFPEFFLYKFVLLRVYYVSDRVYWQRCDVFISIHAILRYAIYNIRTVQSLTFVAIRHIAMSYTLDEIHIKVENRNFKELGLVGQKVMVKYCHLKTKARIKWTNNFFSSNDQ